MSAIETAIRAAMVEGTRCSETGATALFTFPVSFQGFDGHFPGYPILPAVIQVMTGRLVCSDFAGAPLVVQSIGRAKFTREIHPEMPVQVDAVCKERGADGSFRFVVSITALQETAATFSLTCIPGQ